MQKLNIFSIHGQNCKLQSKAVQNDQLPRHQLLECQCEAASRQQNAATNVVDDLPRNDNAFVVHDRDQ